MNGETAGVPTNPTKGFFERLKESNALRNLAVFMSLLGPGIITGSVDHDAGGITTY